MRPILLVEDTPDDVFFLQRAFKRACISHAVEVAATGREAVDFLTNVLANPSVKTVPCLVLLDLKLPYLSGMEVLRWIRAQKSLTTLPVIVLTSSREDRDIHDAYLTGANSFKVKPADANELANFAAALKQYWLEHDEACSSCMRNQSRP